MAKVKVTNTFIDIHTNQTHQIGDVFEADDARIAEIKKVRNDLIEVLSDTADAGHKSTGRKKKESSGAMNE